MKQFVKTEGFLNFIKKEYKLETEKNEGKFFHGGAKIYKEVGRKILDIEVEKVYNFILSKIRNVRLVLNLAIDHIAE